MITINQLRKPIWKTVYTESTPNSLCNLSCLNSTAGELTVKNTRQRGYNKFLAELKNNDGEKLGSDLFGIYPEDKKIFDFNMEIKPQYRQKNLFFGELLKIKGIIEMLENKFKTIELTSKETAVYFHSKFLFEPNIKSFTQRDYALKTIANNRQSGFEEFSNRAELIQESIRNREDNETKRNLCKITTDLVQEYINKVLSSGKDNYKNHLFEFPIDMVLTKEKVEQNSTFFNNLFKKHGIDYNI